MKRQRTVLDFEAINNECKDKLRFMYLWQRQVWLRKHFPYLFSDITHYQDVGEWDDN